MILVLRNSPIEGLGYLEEVLSNYHIRYNYFDTKNLSDDILETLALDKYSGLIILGGPQSVYEENIYPYLTVEKKVIDNFINNNKPILGICLGSQLIASTLGARVYKGDKGEEIGWYDIKITGDGAKDPVFSKYYSLKVFQWHSDTFDLPKDAVRIATSDNYLNQAFKYKKNVYAIQFHTEVRLSDAKLWIEKSNLNRSKIEQILGDFDIHFNQVKNINNEIVWHLFVNV
ncbi:MAG: type 1 glutamine amidotransferase [Brevinematales bacterium]|nr:type 1 glutamine amidotransferase [Brevinematales bacterium]